MMRRIRDVAHATKTFFLRNESAACVDTKRVSGYNHLCPRCTELVHATILPTNQIRSQTGSNGFSIRGPPTKLSASHHEHLGVLGTSAQLGCHLCSLMDSADPHYPSSYGGATMSLYTVKIEMYGGERNFGKLVIENRDHSSHDLHLYHTEPNSQIGFTLGIAGTDAPSILRLAATWLTSCEETYETCRACSKPSSGPR